MMPRRAYLFGIFVALSVTIASGSRAADEEKVVISADSLSYDDVLGYAVAQGNVEILIDDRIMLADTLTYNERDDIVTAMGNVILVEPKGAVYFADDMVLTDGLKRGVINELRAIWPNNTRFAMDQATFVNNTVKLFSRVVMSPCDLCEDDPTRAPVWQIKADEIIHDEVDRDITIYDAWLEMFGIPVFYSPYLSGPDPTIDRRSGFITPAVGFDSELGFTAQTPYFINLGPDVDFTVAPLFATKVYPVMVGEYRQHFGDGRVRILGSGTYAEDVNNDGNPVGGDTVRGHIEGNGQFDINQTWRWGFDLHRASDNFYLRTYNFNSPTTLVSDAYVEGFNNRSYASAETFFFQGQRSGDQQGDTPIVVPYLNFNHVTEPDQIGGRWGLDANVLNIIRTESVDTFRVATSADWVWPLMLKDGQLITLSASVLGEFYHAGVLQNPDDPFGPSNEVNKVRLYPQLVGEWKYPFVRRSGTTQQLIEPIVQLVFSPPDPNSDGIPNEDSVDLRFSDANLFESNRFPGFDRLDGGGRVVYGVSSSVYGDRGGFASIFLGQSYRFYGDTVYPVNSGLDDPISDFVGRIQLEPIDWASLIARIRLDKDDFAARVIEINGEFDFDPVKIDFDYVFVDEVSGEDLSFNTREEFKGEVKVGLTDYWSIAGSHRHDFVDEQPLRTRIGAYYTDECFDFVAEYTRSFFDNDLSGDNRLFVSLTYKHLGEIATEL